ncbi:spermidine N1-acetyltransferase [Prescottella subtropica]|uniref:spermidine N1-acetyltransferase n=1 Tax=Prescottella subtropica TaxID=2545757 RepID=UPI0010F7462C|nr:spermidine N1-acetyltransferase [Prescottella subtropica]
MTDNSTVALRPLERADLPFVHALFIDAQVMRYWFEEPYTSLAALTELYDRHVHDERQRRFVIEVDGNAVGLVELVEIDHIHRNCEFQIIVAPGHQGRGYAGVATRKVLAHAFATLNLHKVYLLVDTENHAAVHIYEKVGFAVEGVLREEYFAAGRYRDATRMGIFQRDFLATRD